MSEKKMVRRRVAVASGVICVLLAVGLMVVLAMLSNANSTITQKDNMISDKDNEISAKDNLISTEENEIASLTNVTLLRDSLVWAGHQATTEPSGSYSTFGTNTVSYAEIPFD
jgi:predicted PurR-regulated permease PerM